MLFFVVYISIVPHAPTNHPTAVAIRTAHHGCRITNPNTKSGVLPGVSFRRYQKD
jgi:hypothetical protein